MKTQIEKLLSTLGFRLTYCSNYDDCWQGFEFNPTTRVLIRFAWGINEKDFPGAYVSIDKWEIRPANSSVFHKNLLYGRFTLKENGEWDSDFYYKFIKNYIIASL